MRWCARRAGTALLLVPEAETTRHRADVALSWCESAQANLPPEVRVRCVVSERAVRGAVVGQLPQPAMQRIQAMILREGSAQKAEGGWPPRSRPYSKGHAHACMQKTQDHAAHKPDPPITPEVWEHIFSQAEEGQTLRQISTGAGMPTWEHMRASLRASPALASRYARAGG